MLEVLFDNIYREEKQEGGFSRLSRSQLHARRLAEKTVAELERKGQTGLTIDEVELFLRALAALKSTPVPVCTG
jgi:hypothetical protein